MSFWNPKRVVNLDPGLARQLLAERRTEIFPGVRSQATNLFEERRCEHCQGLHSRKCPAVAEVSYHESGKVSRVVYWPEKDWDDSAILWLDDVMEAASREEAE